MLVKQDLSSDFKICQRVLKCLEGVFWIVFNCEDLFFHLQDSFSIIVSAAIFSYITSGRASHICLRWHDQDLWYRCESMNLAKELVTPNASFANFNETPTTLQTGKRAGDVVVMAEAVQNHIHSLCSLLLQEGLHVRFKFVSAATACNVLHSQTPQIRMFLLAKSRHASWAVTYVLPVSWLLDFQTLLMCLWSRLVSSVFRDIFKGYLSREILSSDISERWFWWLWSSSAPAVANTSAPTYLAYWIATKPTPPAAAWIKTS